MRKIYIFFVFIKHCEHTELQDTVTSAKARASHQNPDFCKPINIRFFVNVLFTFRKRKCLPKISITDPVLSSFAGRNPPNPVLAVTSGRPEFELDP